ncbi:MAG TPA: TadE/TadG family type IV pilus assembly protein [Jatrophihabitans sp.]|jgi:Flp pilus assembly protein TadG
MARERDDGAAVVEFVLVSVLLVLLLFGVLQVGVYFYARNIVAASAADAARYAAAAGVDPGAGGPRAERLIHGGLAGADVTCRSGVGLDPRSHLPVTTVRCTGRVKAFLAPIDIPLTVDQTSSALREQAP